jgi:hypothetical protein
MEQPLISNKIELCTAMILVVVMAGSLSSLSWSGACAAVWFGSRSKFQTIAHLHTHTCPAVHDLLM